MLAPARPGFPGFLGFLGSLALLASAAAALVAPARGFALTVNTLVDEADGSITDGDVSLRDAIALAPEGDTITFSVTGTIKLTKGQIVVTRPVTILGPGRNSLTIDASGSDPTPGEKNGDGTRIFSWFWGNGSNTSANPLVIRRVRLTGGDLGNDASGGAIEANRNLTIDDCEIASCRAGYGGAIAAYVIQLRISSTSIFRNSARFGSAVYASGGNLTSLTDVFVKGNVGDFQGAVVYSSSGGLLQITRGAFAENRTLWLHDRYFSTAAVNCVGTLRVIGTLFYTNRSSGDGGAIWLVPTRADPVGADGSGFSAITQCYFSGNFSEGAGGAVAVIAMDTFLGTGEFFPPRQAADVTIANNKFDQNKALAGGGAVYMEAQLSRLGGNLVTRNVGGSRGGGLYISRRSVVSVRGDRFEDNYAPKGGAIYSSGKLTVIPNSQAAVFANNRAGSFGSAIASDGTLDVSGALFTNRGASQTTAGTGGALYVTGPTTVSDSTFESGRGRIGGAIATSGRAAKVTVGNSTFRTNIGDYRAGAIDVDFGSSVTVRNSTFTGNTSPRGADVHNSGTLDVDAATTIGDIAGPGTVNKP